MSNWESKVWVGKLCSSAGVAAEEVSTKLGSEEFRQQLEQISAWFNSKERLWYKKLKMSVSCYENSSNKAYYYSIKDVDMDAGIISGCDLSYEDAIGFECANSKVSVFSSSSKIRISLKNTYFRYVQCENGHVFGLTNDIADHNQLIKICCVAAERHGGEKEKFMLVQNYNYNSTHLYYYSAGHGFKSLNYAIPVCATGDEAILTPFYIPGTDYYVPKVFWYEGNLVKSGKVFQVNGVTYCSCFNSGSDDWYLYKKLALAM